MKKVLTIAALAVTMTIGGFASAKAAANKPVKGKITEVTKDTTDSNATDLKITHGKNHEEATVVVPNSTKVTIDGADKTVADLAVGEYVIVAYGDDGKVASIEAKVGHKK